MVRRPIEQAADAHRGVETEQRFPPILTNFCVSSIGHNGLKAAFRTAACKQVAHHQKTDANGPFPTLSAAS